MEVQTCDTCRYEVDCKEAYYCASCGEYEEKEMYTTYIRNEITMETTEVFKTEKVTPIIRRLKECEPFESAFSICADNSVIDWCHLFQKEWID